MRAGEMYLCGIGSLGAMLDLDGGEAVMWHMCLMMWHMCLMMWHMHMLDLDGGEAEVCMDTCLCSV